MTNDEELAMITEKLQWANARFREAQAKFQLRLHELFMTNQALIDHLEGIKRNDHI